MEKGWEIKNDSKLPIVCFSHPDLTSEEISELCEMIANAGDAWISVYPIFGENTLRACITNYSTTESDLIEFVNSLEKVRARLQK